MINPLIVGKWDGNHVWLQWTPTDEQAYALRMRYLRPGKQEWTKWIDTLGPWPIKEYYCRVPTHAEGTMVQAQVAIHGPAELNWEMAQARLFGYCEADFEFTADRKVTFREGDSFMAMVDADVAAYRLATDLEVPAGVPVKTRMRSLQKSGNNQLDFEGHFSFRPRPGVIVRNLAPSDNDLEMTIGDSVMIEHATNEGQTPLLLGVVNQPVA